MATWVNLTDLHAQTGFAVRTLQYIRAQEPGVLVTRDKGGRIEYKQPDCAINLRRREVDAAKKEATGAARTQQLAERRQAAETREAELRVERLLGEVLPTSAVDEIAGTMADRLRAVCLNLPGNYGHRLEAAGMPALEAESVLESIAEELVLALRGVADELEELALEEDAAGDAAGPS